MINVAIYHQHKLILQCVENYLQQSSEIKPVFTAYDKDSLMQKMANRIVNVLILYFVEISHNDVDLIISLKMKFPKTAILVMSDAKKDDIVIIAGKGQEDYQLIGTEKRHFSDQETVRAFLEGGKHV